MVDRSHKLSVTQQAKLLNINRGTVYYRPPCPIPLHDLRIVRPIDELHAGTPAAGSRILRDLLRLAGIIVGRKHVAISMRCMGLEAI